VSFAFIYVIIYFKDFFAKNFHKIFLRIIAIGISAIFVTCILFYSVIPIKKLLIYIPEAVIKISSEFNKNEEIVDTSTITISQIIRFFLSEDCPNNFIYLSTPVCIDNLF
jgi:hypothetical protein